VKELETSPELETKSDSAAEAKSEGSNTPAVAASASVDELDNIDFLLEEIENKIAPLALA
jgi:hypothetical protein